MKRLIVVYNPNSSQYVHAEAEVLSRIRTIKGCTIGKFAIEKTTFEANVQSLKKLIRDGDTVIAVGGDATAAITANAILESKKDVTLGVLPYGNFNDLARTLGTMSYEAIFGEQNRLFEGPPEPGKARMSAPRPWRRAEATQPEKSHFVQPRKLYPLDIIIDGKHWRYATCYVTIGMTAEAVALFDDPKIRAKMQKGHKSSWRSYLQLANWYFKHRHKKQFIPEFSLNGKPMHKKTSDYAAVNGKSMSRVMKGGDDYLKPLTFRSETEHTTSFPRLFMLMAKSILYRTPGKDTKGDTLEFAHPSTVAVQAEGEYYTFKDVKRIEIRKPDQFIKVIHK